MECCVLHAAVAVPLLVSSLPIPRLKQEHLHYAQVGGHALLGLLLVLVPSWLLSFTVEGEYKDLHTLMQSYVGIFHLSIAVFLYRHGLSPQSRPFVFGRASAAFFVLFTRLFAAWHLSEKSTRGLLISDHFVCSALILDGAWLISEVIRFVRNEESAEDRVHDLVALSTKWAEGRGSRYVENALYLDTAICLCYALFHFALPQHILKLIIRPNLDLDSHHYMWCRIFGAMWIVPALSSFSALTALPHEQIAHFRSRVVLQVGLFVLHIWGHWIDPVYSPNHITAFMVAGFCMSFHISTFYRISNTYADEPEARGSVKIDSKKKK